MTGIVSKTAKSVAELSGQSINLVELSVSHYLLARALEQAGLAEKDVAFAEGFGTASDPTSFLRLAGVPLQGHDAAGRRLCLLRVEFDQITDMVR